MLILEAYPFLVDPPPLWGKIKICKLGRVFARNCGVKSLKGGYFSFW